MTPKLRIRQHHLNKKKLQPAMTSEIKFPETIGMQAQISLHKTNQ